MQLNLERSSAKYQIKKYSPGCITVNEQNYTSSLLVMPAYLSAWSINNIQQLQTDDLSALLTLKPEIILLGTGNSLIFPEASITQVIGSKGIGLEIMTTAAACRTFAILVAEQRNVLAALIVN